MGLREAAAAAAPVDDTEDYPEHVMRAGGLMHYQAGLSRELGDAIINERWKRVREIAEDPHAFGDDVDTAKGALAAVGYPRTDWSETVAEPGTGAPPPETARKELAALSGSISRAQHAEARSKPTLVHGTPLRLTPEQHKVLLMAINRDRIKIHDKHSHLEAWDVRRTLNRIFGFGAWDEEADVTLIREIEYPPGSTKVTRWQNGTKNLVPNEKTIWTVVYKASVRLTIKNPDGSPGAVYVESAAGDATNQPSLGDAHDMAMKTAQSQALKRCAVNLGDQFGLSLYNGGSPRPVVEVTLVGPEIVQGDAVIAAALKTDRVLGEFGATESLPQANELRDEALDRRTSKTRLSAIYQMIRASGDHPEIGKLYVVGPSGDEIPLAALVLDVMRERKNEPEEGQ